MRRIAVLVLLAVLPFGATASPAGAAVAAHCRLVASVDGPELRLAFRLWDGGARDEWRVRFFRDGERVYQRLHTTDAQGRFRIVRTYANERGREAILATATQVETGAVCRVAVRV